MLVSAGLGGAVMLHSLKSLRLLSKPYLNLLVRISPVLVTPTQSFISRYEYTVELLNWHDAVLSSLSKLSNLFDVNFNSNDSEFCQKHHFHVTLRKMIFKVSLP